MSEHKFDSGDLVVAHNVTHMARWYRIGAVGRIVGPIDSNLVKFIAGDYETACGGRWFVNLEDFRPATLADIPRDEWHDGNTTCPDKVGAYEVEWRDGITKWSWWNGERWSLGLGSSPADAERYGPACPPLRWRGITKAAQVAKYQHTPRAVAG